RRGRRARLGARAERSLRRGSVLVEAVAPTRDGGRAEVLPSRSDRALPRPRRRCANVVPACARVESALLDPVGAGGAAVVAMRRLLVLLVLLASLAVPAVASAHPLGNFTVNRFSRVEVSGPRLYVL